MAMISLKDVTKIYQQGARPALDQVSLDVKRGDFVFVVGSSGSGKTTLLRLLLCEEGATEGEIHVAGHDLRRIPSRLVPKYRRSIGFVFQDYKLLPNKTVWQNVAFALEVIGAKHSTVRSVVPQVLETVGLSGKEDRFPHELSGGEAQRVAIARAYANHPQILLADEPTGNLDPTTSVGIMEVLDAINRTGTTILMATHNEEIVNSMRKRVVELHEGVVVRDEESGFYDSAEFYSDAATLPANGSGRGGGVDEMDQERDGIARLSQSVHSGRTGRYGEAFAPAEDTLTWGKGLIPPASPDADASETSDGRFRRPAADLSQTTPSVPGSESTSDSAAVPSPAPLPAPAPAVTPVATPVPAPPAVQVQSPVPPAPPVPPANSQEAAR